MIAEASLDRLFDDIKIPQKPKLDTNYAFTSWAIRKEWLTLAELSIYTGYAKAIYNWSQQEVPSSKLQGSFFFARDR